MEGRMDYAYKKYTGSSDAKRLNLGKFIIKWLNGLKIDGAEEMSKTK